MSIDVTMPKLSDTMEEGRLIRWRKAIGEKVDVGEIIAEVETDKADMEMEAYDTGVLSEIRVQEGESVPVGAVIAVLAEPGARVDAPPARPETPAPPPAPAVPLRADSVAPPRPRPVAQEAPKVAATAVGDGGRVKASPLARKLAGAQGVDLERVRGSGPGGRILEKDVEGASAGGPRPLPAARPVPVPAPPRETAGEPGRPIERSRMQRTTAKRMAEAKRDVPHFYVSSEIAADELVKLKASLVPVGDAFQGLTYTHLLLKALGTALRRVPEMNAAYVDDELRPSAAVNVGVATALPDGLIVPVARACDTTPLAELVPAVNALVGRVREGRFQSEDLTGGTFTLSNLGMFPVSDFAAIVNPPQVGILAVGAIREVPVVREGAIVPGRRMSVTLSCDHRAVDGALAGRFMRELVTLLENPVALLV